MSLPSRERELKPGKWDIEVSYFASLPSRERELKPFASFAAAGRAAVAPLAGA